MSDAQVLRTWAIATAACFAGAGVATVAISVGQSLSSESAVALALPTHPDPRYTPGDIIEGCVANTVSDRAVTANEKRGIRVLYGMSAEEPNVVIDHLVPHALCGADTPNNLWPEEKTASYAKDTVERHVIVLVRQGKVTLEEAQRCFMDGWETCPK